MDKIPNKTKSGIGQNPELDNIPNWTKFRMDKIPNGQNAELDKIQNGQNPKWKNPERTKSTIKPASKIEKVRINSVLTDSTNKYK